MARKQIEVEDFVGSEVFPETYQKMISRPVGVSDLLQLFPFRGESQVIALAATNRLPKDPDADGNWRHDEGGQPIFHPAAAHIALHMSLLKKWLDGCDASYSVEDLVALSIREILEDLESIVRCLGSTGYCWPRSDEKIRVLKSLNSQLQDPELLELVDFS